MSPRLPQSKSYLKILDILYFVEDTNLLLTYDIIEKVIKTTHIFNNVILAFHPYIIKMFLKSNIAVVWIDIWNSQNNIKGKILVNRCFNISPYIVTIRGTNINPSISQYKNCSKWKHTIFAYHIHGSKCQKCNDSHKIKHYRDIT